MRILIVLFLCLCAPAAMALEHVTVQLNWKHQFQFAGLYAAIDKGFFRQAGLNVELREAIEGRDPVDIVLDGEADFGVAASELALHRAHGRPVVALATIFQQSPLILLVNGNTYANVTALEGARIMLMPHESELFAYLRRSGVQNYTSVPNTFEPQDLIDGRVDALAAYATDEPYALRKANFPYRIFSPSSAGINFYGDTVFAAEHVIKNNEKRTQAFRMALLQGWAYALTHPEEIADLILTRYSTRHDRDHLLFEAAELKRLIQPEVVDIGQQSKVRWQQIAQTYVDLGLLPAGYSIAGLIYDPDLSVLPSWFWFVLSGALMLLVGAGAATIHFAKLNRRLQSEMESRQHFEGALMASEERYRQLAEYSKDVIWTLNVSNWCFTYISPSVEWARGFSAPELLGKSLETSLTPESWVSMQKTINHAKQRLEMGDMSALSMTVEVFQPHKNGSVVESEVVASFLLDPDGQPETLIGVERDISERRRVEAKLRNANETLRAQLQEIETLQVALKEQAIRDGLTGCFNRRYLDETLEREVSRARREGYPLSLLFIDIDFFKKINDTYGHQAGDRALVALAKVLRSDIRHEDVLCRYGGEEFIVLMPRMPLDKSIQRAEAWREKIADIRVSFGNFELSFTASIGISCYPDHGKTPDELARSADTALYRAKNEGRNRVVVASADPV